MSAQKPLQFVKVFGTNFDASIMKGTTLVIPCQSIGMSANLASDLFILNEGMTKIGYIKSDYISPMVTINTLGQES